MQFFTSPPVDMTRPVVNVPQNVPVYRILKGKFFVDDTLYEAGRIIAYEGEPNLEMQPLNDLAAAKHQAYRDKLEEHAREVARLNNKAYISMAGALQHAYEYARVEGNTVRVLDDIQQVPQFANPKRERKAQLIEPVMAHVPEVAVVKSKAGANAKTLNDMMGAKG